MRPRLEPFYYLICHFFIIFCDTHSSADWVFTFVFLLYCFILFLFYFLFFIHLWIRNSNARLEFRMFSARISIYGYVFVFSSLFSSERNFLDAPHSLNSFHRIAGFFVALPGAFGADCDVIWRLTRCVVFDRRIRECECGATLVAVHEVVIFL
jgi:hypothetical protein